VATMGEASTGPPPWSSVPRSRVPAVKSSEGYEASFAKEIASLLIGAVVTYFSMRAMFHMLDPQREEKEKARKAKANTLGRLGLSETDTGELDEHESNICADVLSPEDMHVGFDDIGGLEDVKQSIVELIVFPLQHPHLFQGKLLRPPRGILLYGPPGTGKTMLAKAIAKESGASAHDTCQL
jgi:hypothetical protein